MRVPPQIATCLTAVALAVIPVIGFSQVYIDLAGYLFRSSVDLHYVLYPFPLHLAMLAFETPWLLLIPGPVSLALVSPQLFKGDCRLKRRSFWSLLVLTILDIVYIGYGWRDGLHYQGVLATRLVGMVTVAWVLVVWTLFVLARRKQTYFWSLAFHFCLCFWFIAYCFPWLGEMP